MEEPRMICKERASGPSKLTDNWRQQGEVNARDSMQMRGIGVFQYVVARLSWNSKPKGGRDERKKLSLLKLPNSVYFLEFLLIFAYTSINAKIITKQIFKKRVKKIIFSSVLFQDEGVLLQYQDANQDFQGPSTLHSSLPFIKIHGTSPQTVLYPLQLL